MCDLDARHGPCRRNRLNHGPQGETPMRLRNVTPRKAKGRNSATSEPAFSALAEAASM
jgi:hypothetical protein